jgi:hypothetical protein
MVWDWYMEWYSQSRQGEVFRGQAAMDCPWCRQPVVYNYKTQEIGPAPAGMLAYQRDEQLAAKTATLKNHATLEAFLIDPQERRTTTPFRFRYWPTVYLPIKGNKS